MTKRKLRFVAGRTIAKRIGADELKCVVEKVLTERSNATEQARELEKDMGYPVASAQAIIKIVQYARRVGIESAYKAWGTPLGGPRVEQ